MKTELQELIDRNDKMFEKVLCQLDDIEAKVVSINKELKKITNNEER